MKLTRPRLTVRRLMIAVALAGVALGGWIELGRLGRLSADYAERARLAIVARTRNYEWGQSLTHAEWLDEWRSSSKWNREMHDTGRSMMVLEAPPPPDVCRVMVDHYSRLEAKYRRAARYPWLAVQPDPPTPKPKWTRPE